MAKIESYGRDDSDGKNEVSMIKRNASTKLEDNLEELCREMIGTG